MGDPINSWNTIRSMTENQLLWLWC